MRRISLIGLFMVTLAFAQSGYKVGDEITDFSLKNIDESMVSLADYEDAKGFIITFTCNHCPFAKAYEERIMALDVKYKPKGFPVIAINPNDPEKVPSDSFENMIKRAGKKGYTFPYLIDETQDIARRFGATKTPHVFVVNKTGGKLTVEYIGAIDNNTDNPKKADQKYVENAVDALLVGNKPEVTETKALGCTIKWKK